MENGPLFDKVKKLGGEKALEELNALVKEDAKWKPSGDANPPEKWKEGHGLRNSKHLKPLRTWLETVGRGNLEEGLEALVDNVLKSKGKDEDATGEKTVMAAGRFLELEKPELVALSVAFNVYVGPTAVRHNACVLGGIGMKERTHMSGPDAMYDEVKVTTELENVTLRAIHSVCQLATVAYIHDPKALTFMCRNARRSYFQGGVLPAVLEAAAADDDSWKQLLFRGTDGADTPVFRLHSRGKKNRDYIQRRLRNGRHVTIPALTVLSKEEKIELLVQQELYVRKPVYDNLLRKGEVFEHLFEINNLKPTEERLRQLSQLGASKEIAQGNIPDHQTHRIGQLTREEQLSGRSINNYGRSTGSSDKKWWVAK